LGRMQARVTAQCMALIDADFHRARPFVVPALVYLSAGRG